MKKPILLFMTLIFFLCLSGCKEKAAVEAPLFNNIGQLNHPITTTSPLAQRYFNQGLALFYGFDFGESTRSFRAAIDLDPHCAMCYWGLALVLGSNNNGLRTGHEQQDAKIAITTAAKLADPLNASETAYIAALSHRYSTKLPKKIERAAALCSSSPIDPDAAKSYANEMRKLTYQFPEDIEAHTLFAIALFDVNQWEFWDRHGQILPNTTEIKKTLDFALAHQPLHIGANHFYIHLMEQSPHPEQALKVADHLPQIAPQLEHLVHMPSHIYFLTGRFHQGTLINQQATLVFEQYQANCRAQGFEPEINHLYFHNLQFLAATASMEGRKALALNTADKIQSTLPPSWLAHDDYLQEFLPIRNLTLARFGEWQAIVNQPKPAERYSYALGLWYYAQSLARAGLNQQKSANDYLNQLKQLSITKNPGKFATDQFKIAIEILDGIFAGKAGDVQAMLKHFRTAIDIQDSMKYKEPPPWYFPVRQLLGDALLKIGQPLQAKIIFEQDLKKYPNNGWSLYGLAQSLRALGEHAEANQIEKQFKLAWQYADIKQPVYPSYSPATALAKQTQ